MNRGSEELRLCPNSELLSLSLQCSEAHRGSDRPGLEPVQGET